MAKNLLCCLTLLFLQLHMHTDAQREQLFFRTDYKYVDATESFYKIHTTPRIFSDAVITCMVEGANIFFPENEAEAKSIFNLWNKGNDQNITEVVLKDGLFKTADGRPAADVYQDRIPKQASFDINFHMCEEFVREAKLNEDFNCQAKKQFMCKKELSALTWDYSCNMYSARYTYVKSIGKCYKVHRKLPVPWDFAKSLCEMEQSYLAVINSKLEAKAIARLISNGTSETGHDNVANIGFRKGPHGWTTVKGTRLKDSYPGAKVREQCCDADATNACGAIDTDGRLIARDCTTPSILVCERALNTFP